MIANVLDILCCNKCGHKHTVTHKWLDDITSIYFIKERLLRIDETLFLKLKCGNCKEKDLSVISHTLSLDLSSDAFKKHDSGLCNICGGDGGAGGRCWKCGGTGYK